jgi:hypothetical protein
MVNKTMESHVLLALVEATTIIAMFDLWMSHGGFDTFSLVVNYINRQWISCHVIVRIFEIYEIVGVSMAL